MRSKHFKHIVDILLGIGLLLLMSYQVTGEAGHESARLLCPISLPI